MERNEDVNYFKGKHVEIRTAPGKQKKTNAHLTTATVTKNIISVFQVTEDLKKDPWTA